MAGTILIVAQTTVACPTLAREDGCVPHAHDDRAAAALDLWLASRAAASRVEAQLDARLRQQAGISAATYAVLCAVRSPDDARSQQAVADGLGLDKSSVSRRLREAAALGLVDVTPSTTSRRENAVSITRAGIDAIETGDRLLDELAHALDVDGTRRLIAALDQSFTATTRTTT